MKTRVFGSQKGGLIALAISIFVLVLAWASFQLVSPSSNKIELSEGERAVLAAKLEKEQKRVKPRYDQPQEALDFYAMQRVPAGETAIPYEKYTLAVQQMEQMREYSSRLGRHLTETESQQALNWSDLGPGNIGGRTRGFVIDPGTPATMYAAGVAGGVWKTTNSGGTWTPTSDLIANIAVASLAMDPGNSQVLYAGTGEGVFNVDAVRGNGIFKTTNGGSTWTQLANTANTSNFHYVSDIVVSHNNSQHVYAATRTGVWRSQDGGTTWTQVYSPNGVNSRCLDLAIRTDQNPDHIFAGCGTFTIQGAIHQSTDGGTTWTQVFTETNMGRVSLAIAPSDEATIYAIAASTGAGTYNNGLHAVFRSTTGGGAGTWTARVRNTDPTKLNTVLLSNPVFAFLTECGFGTTQFLNQGWYDNTIAVDPVNANRVWVGGIDLFRSDDGGANWGQASHWWEDPPGLRKAHADQHNLTFHPDYNGTSNRQLFVGNDGGVFRTDDALAATATGPGASCAPTNSSVLWNSLNTDYGITQFYHGVVYPDGMTYFGGTQDNGTLRDTDDANTNNWAEIRGGDGGYVAVQPSNTQVLYVENTGLSIQRSDNGGATFTTRTSGISEAAGNFLFINPFFMDPSNDQRLWTGGAFLWRTNNQGNSWTQASTFTPDNGRNSALAIAPTNSDFVLAGTQNGAIRRTQIGTTATSATAWAFTTPVSGYVSWLAFDPNDENIAYATYSTFGIDHVWKSTDAGATWAAIDRRGLVDGIPDIPVHTITVDPTNGDRLFVGTDLGIFVTTDGGTTWAVENGGFANTVIETIVLQTVTTPKNNAATDLVLHAFSHGRGVFTTTTPGGAPSSGTRYVATTGVNTGDCTNQVTPCLTIGYAVSQANPGEDIDVAAGTYLEPGLLIVKAVNIIGAGVVVR